MSRSVAKSAVRTHAKTLRSDLQQIRAGSHMLRITANPPTSREAVRHAMAQTGTSQKAMALTAGIPESVLSEAMNERGRNLETDWILAQGPEFVAVFFDHLRARMGLTEADDRALRAARIGELVRLLVEAG